MLTLAVARSETIAHKSAVALQSQRVSSGPGSGQDVLKRTAFAVASQTIPRPQRCWMLGGASAACKKFRWRVDRCNRSKRAALLALQPLLRSASSWAIADDPVLAKTHMTAKRAYVLAAEEDQNDACEDEMNALFEFLTRERAICPTA